MEIEYVKRKLANMLGTAIEHIFVLQSGERKFRIALGKESLRDESRAQYFKVGEWEFEISYGMHEFEGVEVLAEYLEDIVGGLE